MVDQTKIMEAWKHIRSTLFCEKTGLIYDYITSYIPEHRFEHLPHLDEIAIGFPNNCGWSTGMEDCMLNAGAVLDALASKYEVAPTPDDANFARILLQGIYDCSHIHGNPGFLVRGISPRDGRSCYPNSSRDQYTYCVYGIWRYCQVFGVDSLAQKILEDFAAYCAKVLTLENDNLLQLNGLPALVSDMRSHAASHEALRLPMIYLAAAECSGNLNWKKYYDECIDEAIEKSLLYSSLDNLWDISLSQMQLSLSLLDALDPRPEFKKLRSLVADSAALKLEENISEFKTLPLKWSALNDCWRLRSFFIRRDTLPEPTGSAVHPGGICLNTRFPECYERPATLLRAAGNYMIALLLGTKAVPKDLEKGFLEIADAPDYNRHASDGSVKIIQALELFYKISNQGGKK